MDWAEQKAREIIKAMCEMPHDSVPDPETTGMDMIATALRAERATFRDQFAMAALPCLVNNHGLFKEVVLAAHEDNGRPEEYLVRAAYSFADIAISERGR
jgi:hypothetical protein